MNNNGTLLHNHITIMTQNNFLRHGLISFMRDIHASDIHTDVKKIVFIDVCSLKFISDLGVILNNAYINGCSVILVCSGGEMSMVLGRLPHINAAQSLSSWEMKIRTLLCPNLIPYYLKEFNELLFLKKLGVIRLLIIFMISKGISFNGIAQTLSLPDKTLYRYIGGLVSYFNMKNSSFLFFFLKTRFPPSYFDSWLPEEYTEKKLTPNNNAAVH